LFSDNVLSVIWNWEATSRIQILGCLVTWKRCQCVIDGEILGMTSDTPAIPIPAAETIRSRRFGVYDVMVIIAGVALLFAFGNNKINNLIQQFVELCRAAAAYYGFLPAGPYGPRQFLTKAIANHWSAVVWHGVQAAELLILVMTTVFLLMRLRRPRPPIRVLLRQPGTVAGLAVTIGLILVAGWMHRLFFGRLIDGTVTPIAEGGTVALAWTCLALVRKWEAEPSWVDRMGRLIGATAILVSVIAYLAIGLFP
jgi:hypothetical protein